MALQLWQAVGLAFVAGWLLVVAAGATLWRLEFLGLREPDERWEPLPVHDGAEEQHDEAREPSGPED